MAGAPKFVESQSLPDVDYAGFAAGLGLAAVAVDKPDDIAPAWQRALAADRPVVRRRQRRLRPQASHPGDAGCDIRWFEEPVSSDDLEGLREVRDAVGPDVTAGEYGYDLTKMINSGGNRNPTKPDLGTGTRAARRRIDPALPEPAIRERNSAVW